MKYRKKPVVIEAIQFTDNDSAEAILRWSERRSIRPRFEDIRNPRICTALIVRTLEGNMIANPGDYIIKGVQGEFYPCKPEIFAETYEPVTE